MTTFKPTFLYIKQHSITGKLYFGKTTRLARIKTYKGSGIHWKSHIEKHGKEYVTTLWYCLFTNLEELTKFALLFSKQQNIINSLDWLNHIIENGLDGGQVKTKGSFKSHTHPFATKVVINNIEYSSIYNASKILNISRNKVLKLATKISKGIQLKYKGISSGTFSVGNHPKQKSITLNGIIYSSVRQASLATGLSRFKINKLI